MPSLDVFLHRLTALVAMRKSQKLQSSHLFHMDVLQVFKQCGVKLNRILNNFLGLFSVLTQYLNRCPVISLNYF